MKLGVAGYGIPDDLADIDSKILRNLKSDGFSGFFGGSEEKMEALGSDGRKRLKNLCEDEGVEIASWFVVTQTHIRPNHPDKKKDVESFRRSAEMAVEVGCKSIGTSPGSLDDRGRWFAHPDNWKQEPLDMLAESLSEIVKFFEGSDVKLCLEYGSPTVVNTPERALWLAEQVNSPNLGAYADPANWIHGYDLIFNNTEVINHAFDVLGDSIYAAHARDFWVDDGAEGMTLKTGGAGQGLMDYETFLKRANDLDPDMSILFEHTPQDKILDARDYIRETASWIGLPMD